MANGNEFIPALLLALIMSLLGSLAKYAHRPVSERTSLLKHVAVSLFAGVMMALYGLHEQWSLSLLGLSCGAAGWQGAAIIKKFDPPGFSQSDNGDDNGKN